MSNEEGLTQSLRIFISPGIGDVSAEITTPPAMRAMLTLAHGAGAGMYHPFMKALSDALQKQGIGTIRFNFPFIEKQKKRPDVPAVAQKTIAVVLDYANEHYGTVPLFAAGKSFGGRMTSLLLSQACPSFVKGIVFFGFPLHQAGLPSIVRAQHLYSVYLRMLFIQGTRDALASIDYMRDVCAALPTATLVTIEGADHAFSVSKRDSVPALATAASAWIYSIV